MPRPDEHTSLERTKEEESALLPVHASDNEDVLTDCSTSVRGRGHTRVVVSLAKGDDDEDEEEEDDDGRGDVHTKV